VRPIRIVIQSAALILLSSCVGAGPKMTPAPAKLIARGPHRFEHAESLPPSSVLFSVTQDRGAPLDPSDPSVYERCTTGTDCVRLHDYSLFDTRPFLHVRLSREAVDATGYFHGRVSNARLMAMALEIWKDVPATLALRALTFEFVLGSEYDDWGFAADTLDHLRPRPVPQGADSSSLTFARAAVVVEAQVEPRSQPIQYVDGVPVPPDPKFTADIRHIWAGRVPPTIQVGACEPRRWSEDCLHPGTAMLPAPAASTVILFLVQRDSSGVLWPVRVVKGTAMTAERAVLENLSHPAQP